MQEASPKPAILVTAPPNKLQQALEEHDGMVAELTNTKASLAEMSTLANRLQAENDAIKDQAKVQAEFLTRQVDLITAHRDRLQTSLKGLMTRFKVIRECFQKCEEEALAEGLQLDHSKEILSTAGAIKHGNIIGAADTAGTRFDIDHVEVAAAQS